MGRSGVNFPDQSIEGKLSDLQAYGRAGNIDRVLQACDQLGVWGVSIAMEVPFKIVGYKENSH